MASWVKLTMRFPGRCLECGKPIATGQQGLWSRGVGVKHVQCASSAADSSDSDAVVVVGGGGGIGDTLREDATTTKGSGPAPASRITCTVCGRPAGCPECEFQDACDIPNVSPGCLCRDCGQKDGVIDLYIRSVESRFPVLSGPGSA